MSGRFGAVVTAMATPFTEQGDLDLEAARSLARWLLDTGTDALVVHGSTGEAATMTDGEKADLVRLVKEVAGDAPVIAGTGTYDTRHSIHLSEAARDAGADALLIVCPYYNKPPQRGVVAHYRAIAEAVDLPVLAYNIPGRTAMRIEHGTLLQLAEIPGVVGVKDATADLDGVSRLIAEAPAGFEVYSGDDWATFAMVALGAVGVISVAAHLAGERMGQMIALAQSGDAGGARKIHESLLPLYRGLFITSNPIPLKAALDLAGHPVGPPRLPLVPATEDERAAIRKAMEDAGVL
ncbi:MAG TPA: 4-hydroxy-tetrahydrodipicolinate synthase [Actinomycetota bacterium]|nr:4-hydroxy-tetrahydrodipicolinate synthase [Candidatus Acidoferrum sp.]HYU57665.1 4-hydroxy-tetrahydrodipicolinate synthase [Actinomycetota bacterium]